MRDSVQVFAHYVIVLLLGVFFLIMCIAFWSLTHPDYSLILCENRDEFLSRPTDPAHWHSFESLQTIGPSPNIPDIRVDERALCDEGATGGFVLSGVDTLAGGTWFGMNRHGDVALLTNITEPNHNVTSTRGQLCASFLLRNMFSSQSLTLSQFVDNLAASEMRYAGFNMLLLAPVRTLRSGVYGDHVLEYDVAMLSNGGAGNSIHSISPSEISNGLGCISNDTMTGVDAFTGLKEETEWPKTAVGRELLSDILATAEGELEENLIERLFHMMRTKTLSPPRNRREMQETIMVDPIDLSNLRREHSFAHTSKERMPGGGDVEPIPVHMLTQKETKDYATRLASVLLVRKDGQVLFVERDVWITDHTGEPILVNQGGNDGCHERKYRFQIG